MIFDVLADRPLIGVIAAGEIGFWVVLAAGLAARYLLRWRRVSTALLLATPLIDVVVLVATVVDLRGGGQSDFTHGLAATYLGFSVVFGRAMVRWADQRFAHRFADGPAPWRPPRYGADRVRHEWREWGKAVLACALAAGFLLAMIAMVDDPARSAALWGWPARLGLIVGVWFAGRPLWTTLAPPRKPAEAAETAGVAR